MDWRHAIDERAYEENFVERGTSSLQDVLLPQIQGPPLLEK